MTLTTRRLACVIVPTALLGLALMPVASRADFRLDPNPGGDKFFIGDANKAVTRFTGTVGGQHSGPRVTVTTVGPVDTGAGYATVKPEHGTTLTSLTFTPEDPNLFNGFNFRGELAKDGSVKVTVQDNQGHQAQTFTSPVFKNDKDFKRFGILSTDGETIRSVTITADTFKQVKQFNFSERAAAPVPEPAAALLACSGAGLLAAGYTWRRLRGQVC